MKDSTRTFKNCEWTREKTATLISLYQSHECLWNNFIESYKCKDKRTKAIEEICHRLKLNKVDFGKKIHNLRNQFNAEMKKLEKRNESSSDNRRSRWEHYESLMFLKDVIAPRPGFVMGFKGPRKFEIKYSMLDEEDDQHPSSREIQETADAEVQYEETTETDTGPNTTTTTTTTIEFETIPVASREEILESKYHRPSEDELETQEYIHHRPSTSVQHQIIQQPLPSPQQDVLHMENTQIPMSTTSKVIHMETTLPPKKRARTEEFEEQKRDQWDVFGEFVAAEFKNLNSELSRKKLKRKIMQVMLEVGEEDDGCP